MRRATLHAEPTRPESGAHAGSKRKRPQ